MKNAEKLCGAVMVADVVETVEVNFMAGNLTEIARCNRPTAHAIRDGVHSILASQSEF